MSLEKNVQGGRAFGTKFAVKDKNMLWTAFPTHAGSGFICSSTKEVLLHLCRCIYVDCSRDMAATIFIIESAVDNLVRRDLRIEDTIQ